jgi:type IV fimbrial biogenesis protein FimT
MTNNFSITAYMKNMKGLTLIELVVTMAVIAVLVAIGVPRMQGISQNNRVTSAINSLSSDMAFARSEAVTRNTSIRIRTVNGGGDWSGGWVVQTADGVTTLRNAPPLVANILLDGAGGADSVTYRSDGTQTGVAVRFRACKNGDTTNHGRQISINTAGRISLTDHEVCPLP